MANPARDTTAGRVYNDLRNLARRNSRSTDEIMVEYVLERFLYRLAVSLLGREHFVLKGGLLLAQFGARRMTRDIDILGRSFPGTETEIVRRIAVIAATEIDDGVAFDPATLTTVPIREEDDYHGVRLSMAASIAWARLKLQLDVSFGDRHPRPSNHRLPTAAHDGKLPDPLLSPRHRHRRKTLHRCLPRRPQHPRPRLRRPLPPAHPQRPRRPGTHDGAHRHRRTPRHHPETPQHRNHRPRRTSPDLLHRLAPPTGFRCNWIPRTLR
ncbi:hypothetical protein SCANM124S_03385 [Streptomyces canus]